MTVREAMATSIESVRSKLDEILRRIAWAAKQGDMSVVVKDVPLEWALERALRELGYRTRPRSFFGRKWEVYW